MVLTGPQFVSVGAFASGTAGLSVGVPAGYAAGDLFLLFVESANQAAATPAGWTQVANSPQGTGTAAAIGAVRLTVFWKITAATEAAVSVTDTGNHTVAQIMLVKGCATTNPIHVSAGGVQATASLNWTMPSVTTTITNTLIVLALATDTDNTSEFAISDYVNSGITRITERIDRAVASGVGGGLAVATGSRAATGAIGTTAISSFYNTTGAFLTIALRGKIELRTDQFKRALTFGNSPGFSSWNVTAGNKTFVAHNGFSAVSTSTNGTTWVTTAMPAGDYTAAYGDGVFVAVAANSNKAATSYDGVIWTERVLPATANWTGVMFGGGLFVATAFASTTLATSPDGITWALQTLPSVDDWSAAAYGNNTFVVTANTNKAASSTDGVTWTARTLPTAFDWINVAYGNGVFLAVSQSSSISATSPNGITWTQREMPFLANWTVLIFTSHGFVAVRQSTGDFYYESRDGVDWLEVALPISSQWLKGAFSTELGKLVLAGDSGNAVYASGGYNGATALALGALTTTPVGAELIETATGVDVVYIEPHALAGDVAVVMAFRDGSATPPSAPVAGSFVLLDASGSGTSSSLLGYQTLAAGGSQIIGPFANATSVAAAVYRGLDPANPVPGFTAASGAGTTVTLPAATTGATSSVVSFAGHQSTNVTWPGLGGGTSVVRRAQNIDATDAIVIYDSAGVAT